MARDSLLSWFAVTGIDMAALRIEYETLGLSRAQMDSDPFVEFSAWFAAAASAGVNQPNAFVLATASQDGAPSARAVLMKDLSPAGLTFYTNRSSRKGVELAANPRAAACFVWMDLHRQVRVEGMVTQVADETSDEYFGSRPPGARLAAAASAQSSVVERRADLEARLTELTEQYPGGDVPRPADWGGYLLAPEVFEFWQGRPDRFHDRIRYRREGDSWIRERLAP